MGLLLAACALGAGQPAAAAALIPGTLNPDGPFSEFPSDGRTDFTLLLGDEPVGLALAPSPSAVDERFDVRLTSRGRTILDDLTIRWEKEAGLQLETAPSAAAWKSTVLVDRGDVATVAVSGAGSLYEVFVTFTGAPTTIFWFNLDWPAFNLPRTAFSLTFDANGVEPTHTPLPGAVWLLASALAGVLVLRRRRS